jgi:predicted RNA methylase
MQNNITPSKNNFAIINRASIFYGCEKKDITINYDNNCLIINGKQLKYGFKATDFAIKMPEIQKTIWM